MQFQHTEQIWSQFPDLVADVLHADGISPDADVEPLVARHTTTAQARLASGPEAQLLEIQAWRRAFTATGPKPTQYRCASEALLRRLRTDNALPHLHPLVDLCNAASAATAIPVAAFDLAQVSGTSRSGLLPDRSTT